ncbi:heparinase II/III family protein [Kribbella jejuensis]|uniref:Heparinase II/III-like protein n=1 Tax=Kribbella jejuensis TaxID=236068 RepID=A0A542EL96_9ACTN|nr:heparinase II/III family protein [Kribbella jejuensis]TQJ16034.1 heparinase II/III-like protein [Kribbella jejuensis]
MGRTLRELLPAELLEQTLGEVGQLLPGIGASAWSDVPAADRAAVLADAEKTAAREWPVLLARDFARYQREGDRVSYETPYFERRRRIVLSALAALLTGSERWIADVVDGVWLVCDEATWTLPAHASSAIARGEALPRPGDRDLDLFCAETGGLLAWVQHLLGPVLDEPTRRRIAAEVDRRVLTPFLEVRDWRWLVGFTNNWNPWIHSNITACALLLEPDPVRRARIVDLVVQGLDVFLDSYPDDGGCDEGASYWTRAGGSLADNLVLLYDATSGRLDGFGHPKLRPITAYLPAMHIADRWYVNFADCPAQLADPSAAYPLYRLGVHTGEPAARRHARAIRRQDDPLVPQIPSMLRVVGALLEPGLMVDEEVVEDQNVYLPQTEVVVRRTDELLLAWKGGHNDESHNHNDVGTFVVAKHGVPRVIDLGVGTYTRQTFSPERYEIFTMQSDYHNLPRINGFSQQAGRSYRATGMTAAGLDLAHAYPAEAGIRSWHRSLSPAGLTDTWELDNEPTELVWHLILNGRPVHDGHTIIVDNLTIGYEGDLLIQLEPIPLTDPKLATIWGPEITRAVLTAHPPLLTRTGTLTLTFS